MNDTDTGLVGQPRGFVYSDKRELTEEEIYRSAYEKRLNAQGKAPAQIGSESLKTLSQAYRESPHPTGLPAAQLEQAQRSKERYPIRIPAHMLAPQMRGDKQALVNPEK